MKTPKTTKTRAVTVRVRQLPNAEGLPLPAYQSAAAAGLDLVAAVEEAAPLRLAPGKWGLVPTGLTVELPPGYEAQIRPRSGLAARHGVTVLNSPGTIDADYRGEVRVILINLGKTVFRIARGERIAQMVVAPVVQARLIAVAALGATARDASGFGSTGTGRGKTGTRQAAGRKVAARRVAKGTEKKPLPRLAATVKKTPARTPKARTRASRRR